MACASRKLHTLIEAVVIRRRHRSAQIRCASQILRSLRGDGALTPGAPAPAVPSVGTPGPINPDPQRNNVDVNPPGQRLPGPAPSMSPPAPNVGTPDNPGQSFTPPPGRAQPGAAASTRPGAAQSANSDGYAECMALWSPSNAGMSRQEWSKTCDQTRLPPKK